MKRARIAIAFVLALGLVAAAETAFAEGLALGSKAPMATTKMKNVDGKMVSIGDTVGKAGTLVVFTCNHCPFAKGWEKRIADLGNTYAKKGIGVILINANDPGKHDEDNFAGTQARAKSLGLAVPYVIDETSAVAKAFGASVTPETFLFDKGGKLVYHGAVDDNHKDAAQVQKSYLRDALEAVAAGKAPVVSESKSLGCGIKFRKS